METLPEQVRPGDLITADFVNRILARLDALEGRVDDLEGGGPDDGSVLITQLIPAGTGADPIRVGQSLQILGENFGFSVGGHRVFFDSTQITAYGAGSSDTRLVVTVPATLGIPPGGRAVTLTVTNGVTTDTRTITVLPIAQTLSGDVDVLWRDDRAPNPDPNPIPTPTGSQTVTFFYRLRSRASLPALFTVNPTISVPAWQGSLQVLSAAGNVIGDRRIELDPDEEVNFAVRATIAPPGAPGGAFDLNVVATAGDVTGGLLRTFVLDEEVEEGDDQIELAFTSFTVFNLGTGQVDPTGGSFDAGTNTITVANGFRLDMTFAATFLTAAVYDVTVAAAAGTTNWSPQVRTPASGSYDETEANVPVNEAPRFSVQPGAAASTTGQVTFRIQREGQTRSQARTYTLARLVPQ